MPPSCSQIVASWVLTVIGLAFFGYLGQIGLIFGFPFLLMAQRIRQNHDSSALERYKQCPACMRFALGYYLFILGGAAWMLIHHHKIMDINLALQMVIFFLPPIIGMLAADHEICSSNARQAERPRPM